MYEILWAVLFSVSSPCETEDATPTTICAWDASEQGNKSGNDFIVVPAEQGYSNVWYRDKALND